MYSSAIIIASFAALSTVVNGHGLLSSPISRSNASDPTFVGTIPSTTLLCHGLPAGPAFNTLSLSRMSPSIDVSWLISAPHNGTCTFSISHDNGTTFTDLAKDAMCGTEKALVTSKLDMGKDFKVGSAVLRWLYNGANGENYESCADVMIEENKEMESKIVIVKTPNPNSMDAAKVLNVTVTRTGNLVANKTNQVNTTMPIKLNGSAGLDGFSVSFAAVAIACVFASFF